VSRSCAAALFVSGFLAFCIDSVPASASEAASRSRKKADRPPDTSAIDRRVAESKAILVGEGVRIFFVDRQYREVPYIRAAGDGAHKSAMVQVKVVKVLHGAGAESPAQILVPITTSRDAFGEGRSPYDREVERLVGKQGIWFGEVAVRKEAGEGRPLENPVTLLLPPATDAKRKGASPGPLPMTQLKHVTDSIARVGPGDPKP